MVRRVVAPQGMVLADPQSHSANVERRTSGGFILISAGGLVAPNEAIRYSSSWKAGSVGASVTFIVTNDVTGVEVFRDTAGVNFAGNAFLDVNAPILEGLYTLEADLNINFFPDHSDFTTFEVSIAAPPPPPPPPGGDGFIPDIGDIKTFGYIALGLGGLILGLQVIGAARGVTGAR